MTDRNDRPTDRPKNQRAYLMGTCFLRQRAVDDATLVGSSGLDLFLDVEDVFAAKGHNRVAWPQDGKDHKKITARKNANSQYAYSNIKITVRQNANTF